MTAGEAVERRYAAILGAELGVYRVESLLGTGAMGRVYRAEHRELHRSCALKILAPGAVEADPHFVERFREEGRAAAGLVHPHIITIHAIGAERGLHFLEMELLRGGTLQRRVFDNGPPGPIRATQIALGLASALVAAHEEGIIHRDVKPENVIFSRNGLAKLADFGMAKTITGVDRPGLTGTPAYMAPELFAGAPASAETDVYALGASYFLLLTGDLPFRGETLPELIDLVTSRPVPEPPGIPARMRACLEAMLAKEPGSRPTAVDAVAQLTDALSHHRDFDALLHEGFSDQQDVTWTRDGDRFLLDIGLADGRSQRVILEPVEKLVLVYSVCCQADGRHHEFALRLNSQLSHGAVAIRNVDGADQYVMIENFPRATVDAEAIRLGVLEVAERADAVERHLTGEDRN